MLADPIPRALKLETMGVDIICAHVGIDQQMTGKSSLELLSSLSDQVHIPLAVAGGIDAAGAGEAVRLRCGYRYRGRLDRPIRRCYRFNKKDPCRNGQSFGKID